MKKILSLAFALVLSLTFAASSYAHGYTYWTSSTKVGIGHFAYSEAGPGFSDSDSGTNYSLAQRFNYHNNLFLLSLRGSLGYVPAKYTGETQGGTPTTGTVHYSLNDFSVGAGIDPRLMNGLMQNELYLSLGDMTHSWMAANSSFSNGATGYDETYQVKYLSLTYKNIYAFNPKVSNAFKVEYLSGFSGTATTKHLFYPYPNFEFNLGGENGYTVAEGARYRLNNSLSLVGDVYYSALFFKHSNMNLYLYEPSSMTHQYGLQLGVHYAF
ncbi:MAG: hypothetical protein M0Z72_00505 [Deltaproteobacteria bacterium]|nr:hypothetical protein [Deltaproteobacteria bacterium]